MHSDNIIDQSNPIWENPDFPHFYWNAKPLESIEKAAKEAALSLCNHKEDAEELLKIEEVYYNSVIEGIELNKQSIRSSLNKNLISQEPKDKEDGAVELLQLAISYRNKPLTHELIQKMNEVILVNHGDENISQQAGQYVGDMLIIKGGRIDQTIIEDKGVPKNRVKEEMTKFIDWYNTRNKDSPLANAIRGHLHFEKIHPFVDGNGRVGRAIMNMSLMSDLNLNVPLALSKAIQRNRKEYYQSFGLQSLDLTATLKTLSPIIESAIEETKKIINLTLFKKRVFEAELNTRQRKALDKIISLHIGDYFEGKLTNQKYRKLVGGIDTKMAQRDLGSLVEKELLVKKGTQKGTHYILSALRNEKI